MRARLVLLVMLAVAPCGSAHQDTMITLEGTTLVGLPPEYAPASFIGSQRKLEVGKNSVILPPCLWEDQSPPEMMKPRFTASWYHDLSIMPPYLSLEFRGKSDNERVRVVFKLPDLRLIFALHITGDISKDGSEHHDDKYFSASCKEQLRPVTR